MAIVRCPCYEVGRDRMTWDFAALPREMLARWVLGLNLETRHPPKTTGCATRKLQSANLQTPNPEPKVWMEL